VLVWLLEGELSNSLPLWSRAGLVAAAAMAVLFNQPVINYLDNFLNFPIGINVPVGSYSGYGIKLMMVEHN